MSVFDKLKSIFEFDGYGSDDQTFGQIEDKLLGKLQKTSATENNFKGFIEYQGQKIRLSIDQDGNQNADMIALSKMVITKIDEWVTEAKNAAAKEFLSTYNDTWRFYSKVDPKNSNKTIDVEDPEISAETFTSRISLKTLTIYSEFITFGFDDDDLFWGHSIMVDTDGDYTKLSIQKIDFHASLFG